MESKKNNLKRYGLIGKNIEYSFSRGYFKEKFENENLPDCSYENFDLNHINEVKEVLGTPGIFGLNVTIPYKREIIPFLDKLSPCKHRVCLGSIDPTALQKKKPQNHQVRKRRKY
jgi:shikimate dehydrogenase